MIKATCKLENVGPISFSKPYLVEKNKQETHEDFEKRTWRERLHYDKETGMCFIKGQMFLECIKYAAKFSGMQIKGRGKSTYTKHFESGIMLASPHERIDLNILKDDVESELLFVPSDGKRGGSSRVLKYFPIINNWQGEISFNILDPIITKPVFEEILGVAGRSIGVGRYRPQKSGHYGRFDVINVQWKEMY
jgi:hypothetical protein